MKKKIKGSNDKTEVQIAELKKKIKKQKQQYETCANDYESQVVINKLLSVSVQNVSLDMMMGLFIGHIASIPWFELEAKGAIFLVEESGELSMKANYNLSPVLANMCDKVPFGRCLCGRAAIDKKIIFSTNVDERHENKYKGMKDHGHYCVPIVSASNDLLGVLTLYVGEGHKEKEKEKKFLRSVASLIANVIEQRRSVDRLVQAEKMVTMGQMAAGIIHDTNNAVGVVMGAVQFLLQGKKKFDPRTKNFLKIIERQTKRIKKINERLLWYARKRTVHHEAVDINELLKTIPSVLTYYSEFEQVVWEEDFKKRLPKVKGDINQLREVFLNVGLNSIQAMNGGVIKVSTSSKNKKYVEVKITDTGQGMSEENIKKIFNPFYTTKKKGSGLGLYICNKIVHSHKGKIEIKSKIGAGTTFTILLPATTKK